MRIETKMDDKEQKTVESESENASAGVNAARDLKGEIIEVLKTCYDPEIPVDIYELGLIYKIEPHPSGSVVITMTLTSPMCPVAGSLPIEVENKVAAIAGVTEAKVDLVWDPPWDPDKMTEAARLELGMM